MPTLNDFITEIITGEYGLDIVNYGKDSNGDFQPFEVDVNGKQYVINEATATKLDTLIAKDFATETTLDTRLSNLETKMDTLNSKIDVVNTNIDDSQDVDNNFNVSQNGSIVATDVDGNIVDTDVKEVRCLSTSTKPNVAVFPLFTYLIEVDTDKIYYNDGTGWVLD